MQHVPKKPRGRPGVLVCGSVPMLLLRLCRQKKPTGKLNAEAIRMSPCATPSLTSGWTRSSRRRGACSAWSHLGPKARSCWRAPKALWPTDLDQQAFLEARAVCLGFFFFFSPGLSCFGGSPFFGLLERETTHRFCLSGGP